jgi:preprotein translocase subunit SecG
MIMHAFLTGAHILICFALVLSVLLQSGKGGGLAGAFGGQGGGQAIFGGRGAATFLSKATTVLGALFLVTALMLAMMPRGTQAPARSVIQERAQETQQAQPGAVPEAAPGETMPGEEALPSGGAEPPAGGGSETGQQQQQQQESGNSQSSPAGGSGEGQQQNKKSDQG